MKPTPPAHRPARRWFWTMLLVALLAMGGFYAALGARPGPGAGIAVAGSGLVLILATAQAARIWLAIERARRRVGEGTAFPGRAASASPATTGRMFDRLFGSRASATAERDRTGGPA